MYVLRLLLMALLFDNEINKFCSVVNYNRIVDENVVLRQSAVFNTGQFECYVVDSRIIDRQSVSRPSFDVYE